MSDDWPYSDEELQRYFNNPESRNPHPQPGATRPTDSPDPVEEAAPGPGFFSDPEKKQAALVLGGLVGIALLGFLSIGLFLLTLGEDDLPSLQELENPELQLATVAFMADGSELARYAHQNRSFVTYDDISPNVINALVSTEDHRFYNHWGIDLFRFFVSAVKSAMGDTQGGSTITMQLARNLYNEEIGRAQTISRKLREMLTAVRLERRYTKREIQEMYLNTVEFGNNAFGIETAARTFFNKKSSELDTLEAATLVGMQKAITRYNPLRNPDLSRQRRNVVLMQMVKHGFLTEEYYHSVKEEAIVTDFNPNEITSGPAPYFAEYVRNWLNEWGDQTGHNIYDDGLFVYTTLDPDLQAKAHLAVQRNMELLQTVVDYEWSRPRAGQYPYSTNPDDYVELDEYTPFSEFWQFRGDTLLPDFIRESSDYRSLTESGLSREQAIDSLKHSEDFLERLRQEKQRLEAGLVSIDPRNGFIRAWVGGRDLARDWYDHVGKARRQPGSTFKPFVYMVALDSGISPEYTLQDTTFLWQDALGNEWSPTNSEGGMSGLMLTLREGLRRSLNTITGRLVLEVGAENVAFYANQLGIESPLNPVPSLALGTSNVTLLELTMAYSTLANSGLKHSPTFVTRIEDAMGNVLYEATPQPEEALNEQTALKMIDMMREVVNGGTGIRIRSQYGLGMEYDFAGKTGTTQNSADGWFMLMHPELVTGAWVGFNDQRMTFRTNWWGQGAHNALFLVGDYLKQIADEDKLSKTEFPLPQDYGLIDIPVDIPSQRRKGRISW